MKVLDKPPKERFLYCFVRLLVAGVSLCVLLSVLPKEEMPSIPVFALYGICFIVLAGVTAGYALSTIAYLFLWLHDLVRRSKGKS